MDRPSRSLIAALGAVFLASLVLVGIVAWGAGHSSSHVRTVTAGAAAAPGGAATVDPRIAAGAHDFVQFACAQCHGERGAGGVSPDVPALDRLGRSLTVAALAKIIEHGLGESANPTKPYMPVWDAVISKRQVFDLASYIRAGLPAVPDAVPLPVPQGQGAVVAGQALYVRYGCVNCHGPNGLGGVPNPASPDKTIPPLSGGFLKEFNTDAKIVDVIRSGSVLGRAPIVSMPHWGGIIPNEDYAALVAYLKTLKTG